MRWLVLRRGTDPAAPLPRRDLYLPFLCRRVSSADTEDLLQAPPRPMYGTCAFPGPPIALRAGGHDAVNGCSMLTLSFLAVSRPFTRNRALVMRAKRYWRCVGVVRRVCPFAPAALCQNFNHRTDHTILAFDRDFRRSHVRARAPNLRP